MRTNATSKYNVGDLVVYGRRNGQKTMGQIVRVNPSKYKIKQLEARGAHPVGTVWGVPESLILAKVDPAQIPNLKDLLNDVAEEAEKNTSGKFRTGQKVTFEYKNQQIVGTIIRVNQKTCSVSVAGQANHYRIPPSMLAHVIE